MTSTHAADDRADASQRRAEALRNAARDRTARAEKAAERGIRTLLKDGGQVSFSAVARASGVSTKFLHQHPDLASRIRDLRSRQRGTTEQSHEVTATGESAVIAALRRQLREQHDRHRADLLTLRARIAEQDRQIAALYGRLGHDQAGAP